MNHPEPHQDEPLVSVRQASVAHLLRAVPESAQVTLALGVTWVLGCLGVAIARGGIKVKAPWGTVRVGRR